MSTVANEVRLFGCAQLRGAQNLTFLPDKRFQLLAYLAYQTSWVGRDYLQYLFWPDTSGKQAGDNLRQLLRRVRSLKVTDLAIERQQVRWQVDSDVQSFRQLMNEEAWEEALKQYQGKLLIGLEGTANNEFSAWLVLERERLQAEWRKAILNHAEDLVSRRAFLDATALLKPLLDMDDFDEEALRRYMEYSLYAGGREQALKAYSVFSQRLKKELGLSPTSSVEHVAEQLRRGQVELPPLKPEAEYEQPLLNERPSSADKSGASLTNMPGTRSSFVGREADLSELTKRLTASDCRLVTLTGFGGVGKTRLAVALAEKLRPLFQGGTVFIALATVDSANSLSSAIAAALKIDLHDGEDALTSIISLLTDKDILLILDNFEHLVNDAVITQTLLDACSGLKLLITSRERLNLDSEWLWPLEGLSYPKDRLLSARDCSSYDAPKLFIERAKRLKPTFELNQDDVPYLVDICAMVEGSPLGLELAAVWVRALELKAIATEMKQNLDFLISDSRTKAIKHQSLRTVFEGSWQRLAPSEQNLLKRLAVFSGGFSYEAAKHVAGASLAGLASLIDTSLLRALPNGRYNRHTLIYQFSHEKLTAQPDEYKLLRARHGHYFMSLLSDANASAQAVTSVMDDTENIRLAWTWAAETKQLKLLSSICEPMSFQFIKDLRHQEGYDSFAFAVSQLDESSEAKSTLALLLTAQAFHAYKLGKTRRSKELAERGLALATSTHNLKAKVHALGRLSTFCVVTGDYAEARAYLTQNFELAKQALPIWPKFYSSLAYIDIALGHYGEAQQNVDKAYRAHKTNKLKDSGYLTLCQAEIYFQQDEYCRARAILVNALKDDKVEPRRLTEVHISLMRIAYERGAYEEANDYLELAQKTLKNKSDALKYNHDINLLYARLATARGEVALAEELFEKALEAFWKREQLPLVMGSLCFFAEWLIKKNRRSSAVAVFSLIETYPKRAYWLRKLSQKHLKYLMSVVDENTYKAAKQYGQALEPYSFLPALLANWPRVPHS